MGAITWSVRSAGLTSAGCASGLGSPMDLHGTYGDQHNTNKCVGYTLVCCVTSLIHFISTLTSGSSFQVGLETRFTAQSQCLVTASLSRCLSLSSKSRLKLCLETGPSNYVIRFYVKDLCRYICLCPQIFKF